MRLATRLALIVVLLGTGFSSLLAKAPRSTDVMRPVDTRPGSISDPQGLLKANLDRKLSISLNEQPAEIAYNQINAMTGIEFGYMPGVNRGQLVTVGFTGPARDVLRALGNAAGVRFEVGGPTQIRVMEARLPRRNTTPPPPVRRK